MCHWVGHLKTKPIDVDELSYRKEIINELESSLNVNGQTETSVVAEKSYNNLLQILNA